MCQKPRRQLEGSPAWCTHNTSPPPRPGPVRTGPGTRFLPQVGREVSHPQSNRHRGGEPARQPPFPGLLSARHPGCCHCPHSHRMMHLRMKHFLPRLTCRRVQESGLEAWPSGSRTFAQDHGTAWLRPVETASPETLDTAVSAVSLARTSPLLQPVNSHSCSTHSKWTKSSDTCKGKADGAPSLPLGGRNQLSGFCT